MVKPVSQKLRHLPLSLREEVSRELHHLEEQDVIEKIDSSSWISNLVVARWKMGEICLCVDLQAVNKAIIPDKYPLSSQEELMTEFCGSQCSPSWIFVRATFRSLWLGTADTLQLLSHMMGFSNTNVCHMVCCRPQVHSTKSSHPSWLASKAAST